jgi:selenide,water dikinase
MLAVGASAATDITGFGLAGHGLEMAQGSKVTLVIELAKLPLIAGIEHLDVTRYRTRASKTNKEYADPHTRFAATPDSRLLEFFYDAQTSGGLLISVPAAKAADLERELKSRGTPAAAAIGEVREFDGKFLVIR